MEKQLIGYWKFGCGGYKPNGKFEVDEWDCSNCDQSISKRLEYCPCCKAKMENYNEQN